MNQASAYPLGSKWEYQGQILTLGLTMNHCDQYSDYAVDNFGYKNPRRICLVKEDGHIYLSATVADAHNISDVCWSRMSWWKAVRLPDKEDDNCKPVPIECKITQDKILDPMCILCRANPSRDCNCMKPAAKPAISKEPIIVVRRGWDNVVVRAKYGISYLHVESETLLIRNGSRLGWLWKGDCNPKTGKRDIICKKPGESIESMMDRIEKHLKT